MLASTRERRSNAGAKMAALLNQEDCAGDDFYKTTYGGFVEDENDNAYISPIESDGDSFDSDFVSDGELDDEVLSDDGDKSQKTRRVLTGAYKEPVRKRTGEERKPRKRKLSGEEEQILMTERKFRSTTLNKSESFANRLKARISKHSKGRRTSKANQPKMTQAMKLKEAESTEIINLQALASWEEYEAEQKAKRERMLKKRGNVTGARVKYISVTSVSGPDESRVKQSKHFLVWSDDIAAKPFLYLSQSHRPKPKVRVKCPVTGLPALYYDPVTETPYANRDAFKQIRTAYADYVRRRGNLNNPMICEWLKTV